MRQFFGFWWICIKIAARGSAAFANDWQWLLGFPLLGAITYFINQKLGAGTVILSQDTTLGILEAGIIAFCITFIVAFLVRLFFAPAELDRQKKERILTLENQISPQANQGDTGSKHLADALNRQEHHRRMENNPIVQTLRQGQRVAVGLEINPKALFIEVGESGKFCSSARNNSYQTRRTFNLKIENADKRFSVSGGKIQISKIDPQTEYQGPWLLKSDLVLAAGDHEFVPLVTYGESNNPSAFSCGDTFMAFSVPEPSPKLSAIGEHIITIKVTSLETSPREFQCKVWVDEVGHLRIAKV